MLPGSRFGIVAELILLSLPQDDAIRSHRKALAGDPESKQWLDTLFADYPEALCFLCDAHIVEPRKVMFIPDAKRRGYSFATAICPECAALPEMRRWARAIRICKAIE